MNHALVTGVTAFLHSYRRCHIPARRRVRRSFPLDGMHDTRTTSQISRRTSIGYTGTCVRCRLSPNSDWIAAHSVPCTPRSEHRRATAPRSGGDAWPPQEAPTRCSARLVAAGLFIGGATLARGPPHTPPVRVTLRRFPKLSTLLSRPQGRGAFDGPLDSENGCVTTRSGSAADLDTTLGRLQLAPRPSA